MAFPRGGGGSGGQPSATVWHPPNTIDNVIPSGLIYDYEFGATTTSPPSGWSWVNQGSATYSEALRGGALSLATGSGFGLSFIAQSIPSGSSIVTAKLLLGCQNLTSVNAGLVFYDSVSTKLSILGINYAGSVVIIEATSPTVYSANPLSVNPSVSPLYFQVDYGSLSAVTFSYSADGQTWIAADSAYDMSAHVTPNSIGFGIDNERAGDVGLTCCFFRVS